MPTAAAKGRDFIVLVVRGLLAIVGGYVFCWGLIALFAAGTFPLGAELHDGETLGSILALLVYPAAFLWAFAGRKVWLVGTALVGGGALMAGTASLIQMSLT